MAEHGSCAKVLRNLTVCDPGSNERLTLTCHLVRVGFDPEDSFVAFWEGIVMEVLLGTICVLPNERIGWVENYRGAIQTVQL